MSSNYSITFVTWWESTLCIAAWLLDDNSIIW